MANTQAICTSFKIEEANGIHAMSTTVVRGTTAADVWKAALFLAAASNGATTTAYAVTNEVVGAGYTAGGVTFAWIAPAATGTTMFTSPSGPFSWTGFTSGGSFDNCLIYNSTQANRAMGSYTFGAQNVTSANFSLTIPTNDATTGLFRKI
jgi:hypothetical protein